MRAPLDRDVQGRSRGAEPDERASTAADAPFIIIDDGRASDLTAYIWSLAADRLRSGPSGPASSVPRERRAARRAPPRPGAQGAGRCPASPAASPAGGNGGLSNGTIPPSHVTRAAEH